MPPDRGHPSSGPGKQKSCTVCVKSKRKCDQAVPRCLRCARLDLACSYLPPSQDLSASVDSYSEQNGHEDAPQLLFNETVLLDPPSTGISEFDFFNITQSLEASGSSSEMSDRTALLSRPDLSLQKSFCVPCLSSEAWQRIKYPIEQLKMGPSLMFRENQTPWSHVQLYDDYMPRCLEDAYATCALYTTRTPTNINFVIRHIISRLKSILEAPIETKMLELLAQAHALILYQIMLVFGGDFRLSALVDTAIPHLETIGYTLYNLDAQDPSTPPHPLPLYPSASAKHAWRAYILRESCRRTFTIIYHFSILLHVLRGQMHPCADVPALPTTLTLQARLWSAGSAGEWARVWNEGRHFVVRDFEFGEVLREAGTRDLDVFGRVMMVSVLGMDEVGGWWESRGETF